MFFSDTDTCGHVDSKARPSKRDGVRRCRECWRTFRRECQRAYGRQYYHAHRTHRKPIDRQRYAQTADQRIAKQRERLYGISLTEYERRLEEQNGCCAICGKPETRVLFGRVCRLAVDHDHETGQVRGLLCSRCNCFLGLIDDNPELLDRIRLYLIENAKKVADKCVQELITSVVSI